MSANFFKTPVSRFVWETKYCYRDGKVFHDRCLDDTWRRVSLAVAGIEPVDREKWQSRFYEALSSGRFLPGGRILAGAGTRKQVTLFNCFAMGAIEDSMNGIFDALKEGALTMQQGGGIGYDFSTLRPKGMQARHVGGIASGPVSFMRIWNIMCETLLSTGARRGAMMATLRCDHPDIEAFIDAKRNRAELRNFNLSVLVSDEFMRAVQSDDPWPLVFPVDQSGDNETATGGNTLMRRWSVNPEAVPCQIIRTVSARVLWQRIMRATYDYAEPGVLFIDRINRANNLWYRERLATTNPCGEIPLPPYGACNLGSIIITRFVIKPFSEEAHFDTNGIAATTAVAVRMLDNVIDVSGFPLDKQKQQALGARRIGLGITGLADSLIMLGVRYGADESYILAAKAMRLICHTAYKTSVELARTKGIFPYFEKNNYLQGSYVKSLPAGIRKAIAKGGIRNSHLIAIAPTGSISLLADNISNGLEPVFDAHYRRRLLTEDGVYKEHELEDYAVRVWREQQGNDPLPPAFVTAQQLSPMTHLKMQSVIQRYVDNAISKTIYVPRDTDFGSFQSLYEKAFELGLKGCTTFRPNPVTGSVLIPDQLDQAANCCEITREGD